MEAFLNFFVSNINIIMVVIGILLIGILFLILMLEKRKVEKFDSEMSAQKNNNTSNVEIPKGEASVNYAVEQAMEEKQDVVDENIADEIVEATITAEDVLLNDKKDEMEEEKQDSPILDNYESVIRESDAMLQTMQNIIDENIQEMETLQKQDVSSNVENTEKEIADEDQEIVSKYKVIYDKVKKDWVVKKEGASRATKRCETREEAIEFAKQCTINTNIGTATHQKNGRFQKKVK